MQSQSKMQIKFQIQYNNLIIMQQYPIPSLYFIREKFSKILLMFLAYLKNTKETSSKI